MQRSFSSSIRSSPQHSCLGWLLAVETDFSFLDWVLLQWHAQSLGRSCQWVLCVKQSLLCLDSRSLLDLFLAVSVLTPWGQDHVLLVQLCHELIPVCGCLRLLIESVQSVLVHVTLDLFQKLSQWLNNTVLRKLEFFTIVPEDASDFILLHILWTQLNSDWNTLKFPVIVFPAWVVIVSVVVMNSDIRFL